MTEEEKLQMFNNNMKMVYAIVDKHWGKYYIEKDDLIQEGMLTFWNALDKYDASLSTSLSTYVYAVVYTHLNSYVNKYRYGAVARSSSFQVAMRTVKYAKTKDKPIEDACDQFNLSKTEREYAQILAKGEGLCVSLYQPEWSSPDCKTELKDTVPSDNDPTEEICSEIDMKRLRSVLYSDFIDTEVNKFRGKEKDNYRKAVTAYLDSIFDEPRTQCSVAKELGVCRETIRKYYMRLQKHLKNYLLKNKLLTEPVCYKAN